MDLYVQFATLEAIRFPNIDGPPTLRKDLPSLDAPPIVDFKYQGGRRAAAINLNHVAYMTYELDA